MLFTRLNLTDCFLFIYGLLINAARCLSRHGILRAHDTFHGAWVFANQASGHAADDSGDAGAATGATGSDVTVSKELLAKFQSALFSVFEELHAQQVPMDEVRQKVTAKTKLSEAELMACIEHMSSDNKIMLASDILYLI